MTDSFDRDNRPMGGYSNTTHIGEDNPEAGDYRLIRTAGGVTLHMLAPVYIQLQKELEHHPDAQEAMAKFGGTGDWITKLGALAGHLGILMDGHFTAADLEQVANACLDLLRSKRTGISIPVPDFSGVTKPH